MLNTTLPIESEELASSSAGAERRRAVRYPTCLVGSCGRLAEGMDPRLPAKIKNISASGIGLVLRWHFHPGTVLVLKIHGAKPNAPTILYARVVQSRPRSPDEWLVGCQFARNLDQEELEGLIA